MGVKPTYFHIENHHYAAMPVLHLLSCPKMVFSPQGRHITPINVKFGVIFCLPVCLFVTLWNDKVCENGNTYEAA